MHLGSNSHVEVLAGVGRHHEFKSVAHAIESPLPPLAYEGACQGLHILKKGLGGCVIGLLPHEMEQEGQEMQRA